VKERIRFHGAGDFSRLLNERAEIVLGDAATMRRAYRALWAKSALVMAWAVASYLLLLFVVSTPVPVVAASVSLGLFTQLPADGHYFWNLFPGMLVGGVGLALSFVPVTIAGLTGVARADAGVASGLINTSRQVGGAVGLAAVSTIVTASTTGGSAAAVHSSLTSGFQTGFLVLSGVALLGAVIAATLLAPPPERAEVEVFNRDTPTPLEEAA